MKRFLFSAVLVTLQCGALVAATPDATRVLLVVNDSSPASRQVGLTYAREHDLPLENVCHIRTAPAQAINRSVYETEIRDVVGECLETHDLQDRVLYLVTTEGVPLWIEGDPGPVGDLASVDSELTLLYRHLLGRNDPVIGRIQNPYFSFDLGQHGFPPFERRNQDIYLVTRLSCRGLTDCSTVLRRGFTTVRSTGVFGLDLPSQRRSLLQDWIRQTRDSLAHLSQAVAVESTAGPFKGNQALLGYCALLGEGSRMAPPETLKWAPGGIGVVLGDTWSDLECLEGRQETGDRRQEAKEPSGRDEAAGGTPERGTRNLEPGAPERSSRIADPTVTSRDAPSTGAPEFQNSEPETRNSKLNECPATAAERFLAGGASGAIVNVADPTTDGYVRPQILFPAYVAGRNLAESVYLATRYLSWRQVVLGDPLVTIAKSATPSAAPVKRQPDSVTGLPKLFSDRRRALLRNRYSTSNEVISLLVQAEAARAHGKTEKALSLVDESLDRDPSILESNQLRAHLLEGLGRFEDAYAAYLKVLSVTRSPRLVFRTSA
ncbi:MAG: TIGR03790 family protein [Acidobacteriota bacterium]